MSTRSLSCSRTWLLVSVIPRAAYARGPLRTRSTDKTFSWIRSGKCENKSRVKVNRTQRGDVSQESVLLCQSTYNQLQLRSIGAIT